MKKLSVRTRVIIAVCAISVIFSIMHMTNALIAYIINSYSMIPEETVQLLMTIPTLSGLVFSFLIGPLALKVNKRILIYISAITLAIYYLLFGFVGGNGPFALLVVAAILGGFIGGGGLILSSSIISEYIEPEKRATVLAWSTACMMGGGALVNIIGGAIAAGNNGADWPLAYLTGLIIIPAVIVFAIFMPKEKGNIETVAPQAAEPTADKDKKQRKIHSIVIVIIVALVFCMIAASGYLLYFSSYIITDYQLGTSVHTGIANTIYTLAALVIGLTYALWQKIFKEHLALVGFIAILLSNLSMLFFHETLFGVYFAAFLVGVGANMSIPTLMAQIMDETDPSMVPVSMSLSRGFMNLGAFLALFVLNGAANIFGGGVSSVLITAAVCGVIMIVLYFFVIASRKKRHRGVYQTKG